MDNITRNDELNEFDVLENLKGKIDSSILDNPVFPDMLRKLLSTSAKDIKISQDGKHLVSELKRETKGANDIFVFWHQGLEITLDDNNNIVLNSFVNTLQSENNNPAIGTSKINVSYDKRVHDSNGVQICIQEYSDSHHLNNSYNETLLNWEQNLNLPVYRPNFDKLGLYSQPTVSSDGTYTKVERSSNLQIAQVIKQEGITPNKPMRKNDAYYMECTDYEHPLYMRIDNFPDFLFQDGKVIPNPNKYQNLGKEEVEEIIQQHFDNFLQYTQSNNPNAYEHIQATLDSRKKSM